MIAQASASTFRKFRNYPPAFNSQSDRSRRYRISRATETGQPHDRMASASEQLTTPSNSELSNRVGRHGGRSRYGCG